jgi:hypothetical protein
MARKPASFRRRLSVERLEDRVVPADYTWRGPNDGLWTNPANWGPNAGVPGPADTATFDITGQGTCIMDLPVPPNQPMPHVGKIVVDSGYTGTITLQRDLLVDVITMSSANATLDGGMGQVLLWINQDTRAHPVTFFQTSKLAAGTFRDVNVNLSGESDHHATLELSS